ncbi:S8 family serine peptidase [Streptomyces sp. NPDC055107]
MAAFSRTGPTADGSLTPDIAAPGYVSMSGTSMARPHLAGARQPSTAYSPVGLLHRTEPGRQRRRRPGGRLRRTGSQELPEGEDVHTTDFQRRGVQPQDQHLQHGPPPGRRPQLPHRGVRRRQGAPAHVVGSTAFHQRTPVPARDAPGRDPLASVRCRAPRTAHHGRA